MRYHLLNSSQSQETVGAQAEQSWIDELKNCSEYSPMGTVQESSFSPGATHATRFPFAVHDFNFSAALSPYSRSGQHTLSQTSTAYTSTHDTLLRLPRVRRETFRSTQSPFLPMTQKA